MPKRKADEIVDQVAIPHAKYTCFKAPSWSLHGQHRALEMATTPPPDDIETEGTHTNTNLDDEDNLVAHLEASQTNLVKHLDQKYTRMQSVAPQKACAIQSRLAKLAEAMSMLNQEITAMRADASQVESILHRPSSGFGTCRAGATTYFAPHQYVPIPQS